MEKIPTGSDVLDELVGGYEIGAITAIFGPAGAGKTNACMLALIRMAGREKKIVYIDTEARFSVDRLQQITKYANKVLPTILLFTPKTFSEQVEITNRLANLKGLGLIVVDSLSGLYRLEKTKQANYIFKRHIAQLSSCARHLSIPIIVTAQVYSDMETGKPRMVAERMTKNASKCLIELQVKKTGRMALSGGKQKKFCITEKGITCP